MKTTIRTRITASALGAAMLLSSAPAAVSAANVQETEGLQLQTILIDNNGKDWTTESWGGATMTPNTNWTSLTINDYYENGKLNFEVIHNGTGDVNFKLGLVSRMHGKETRIYWTDLEEYKSISAGSSWTSYSLPIKPLVDANTDTDFTLDFLQFVVVGGVPSGSTLSFRNVTITSPDDERQYPLLKVNQIGYFCNAPKSARVTYFEKFGSLKGKTWELVNADTNEIVTTGTLGEGVPEESFGGEIMHDIRFDEVTAPGRYFIRIPNAELDAAARSPRDIRENLALDTITSATFRIGNDVYDSLFSDLAKYYYYQRQGIDLEEAYAGDFARKNLHLDDVAVRRWSDRNNLIQKLLIN